MHPPGMKKRVLAAVLWFMAVAYLWNFVAMIAGVSTAPAFLAGFAAALFVYGDPLHMIWRAGPPER